MAFLRLLDLSRGLIKELLFPPASIAIMNILQIKYPLTHELQAALQLSESTVAVCALGNL